jgi:hypothetical protein
MTLVNLAFLEIKKAVRAQIFLSKGQKTYLKNFLNQGI